MRVNSENMHRIWHADHQKKYGMLQEIPISGNAEKVAFFSFGRCLLDENCISKLPADTNKHYEQFANACNIDDLVSYMQAEKAYAQIMPRLFPDTHIGYVRAH
jgi:hypothetical protein